MPLLSLNPSDAVVVAAIGANFEYLYFAAIELCLDL